MYKLPLVFLLCYHNKNMAFIFWRYRARKLIKTTELRNCLLPSNFYCLIDMDSFGNVEKFGF